MTQLTERVQRIKPSPTLAVAAKADELIAAGRPVINLGVGEPDFDTPEHINAAAIAAIKAGHTRYTAVDGIKPLKQAIIDKFKRDNGLTYQLNQILVSDGAKHSIYNALCALIQAGDEVIIPAPFWVSYPDMVKLVDGTPVEVKTTMADNFKLTPATLEAAITPKTRMLIINSPSNPTGKAYSKTELAALGEVLLKHPNIVVVSDDIYECNVWNHLPYSNIVTACPGLYDRAVVVNGVSKAYAMTGWRIGYAAGAPAVIAAMKKAQSQSTSNPTSISQYAALAALTGDQTCVQVMTKAYRERHDVLVAALREIPGVDCPESDGTFYVFPCVKGLLNKVPHITTDLELADYFLNEANVAMVPGSAFGADGHLRLCYATSMENVIESAARIKAAAAKL
ncbi:MAG TPA: pyridoxal phosphate-dependent aminotransferase [Gammaproteobacteria bacterium]|nr:pyridoxal phosphate-dependent aminotransferase [Gammaproteobacteria bacterium]